MMNDNEKTPSTRALARSLGISYQAVYWRVKAGWSWEDAIAFPRHKRPVSRKQRRGCTKRYIYQGQECTVAQLAAISGATEHIVRGRLARGWSVEDATTVPVGAIMGANAIARKRKAGGGSESCENASGTAVPGSRDIEPKQGKIQ